MVNTPGEEHDHPHQRALSFSHGLVNGHDFWTETKTSGKIVMDALLETTGGSVGILRARSKWVSSDSRVICTDETTIRIQPLATGRLLDYEVTLNAPGSSPLTFGDTKEGTMAIRLAQWMTMFRTDDNKVIPGVGHAITSVGDHDASAWGKRAAWADYFAPYKGNTYGVAIFDHPQNPHHPTWWMLRDYGLFAANPFGRHDFEGLKDQPDAGSLVLPAGGRVTFRYRFYFHLGDSNVARVAEKYREYIDGR